MSLLCVAGAHGCSTEDALRSPLAAHTADGGTAGSASIPDAGTEASATPSFPSIVTGSLAPDSSEPPTPLDDCAALDPKGVQVLAQSCSDAMVVDDDYVYVAKKRPGREGSTVGDALVRIPRCGGNEETVIAEPANTTLLLSAGALLYRMQPPVVERVVKASGAVTPLDASCARGMAVNATHLFVVDSCTGRVLRAAHDATAFETVANGFAAEQGSPPVAATNSYVYWMVGNKILRAPVDGGAIETALDTGGYTPDLIADDSALLIRIGSSPTDTGESLVRIPEDPAYSPTRTTSSYFGRMALDGGFLYRAGGHGLTRLRAKDLGGETVMGDAPIPTLSVLVGRNRLYYCDGDKLITRRASVDPLPIGAARSNVPVWKTLAPPDIELVPFWLQARADQAGNVYTTGIEPSISVGGSVPGPEPSYLLKFDAAGNYAWRQLLPSFEARSLDVSPAGETVLLTIALQSTTLLLSKFDAAGALAWSQSSSADRAIFDANGNVITVATKSDANGLLYPEIAKFDPAGKSIASKALPAGKDGAAAAPIATPVSGDSAGGVLVVGGIYGPVDFGSGPTGANGDAFLARLDGALGITWSRVISGVAISGLAAAPNGGAVIMGRGAPGIDFGAGSVTGAPTASYLFVARYDSSGALVWQRMWAEAWNNNLAVGADGSVFVTGYGPSDTPAGLSGISDSWLSVTGPYVVKLDADGNFRWAEVLAPPATTNLAVTADPTGHALVVSGYGEPSVDFLTKLAP